MTPVKVLFISFFPATIMADKIALRFLSTVNYPFQLFNKSEPYLFCKKIIGWRYKRVLPAYISNGMRPTSSPGKIGGGTS
jgi:hypothetical protein